MKKDLGAYLRADGGLILAITGVVVCLSLLIITGGIFTLAPQIALAMSVVGLGFLALTNPKRIRRAFTRKISPYTTNSLLYTLAILGILSALNYIAFLKPLRWDITEDKQFSLTPDTISILAKINTPIFAQAFYSVSNPSTSAEQLLERFTYQTPNDMFSYEVVDPDENPLLAQQAKVLKDGTIILTMDERSEQVTYATEQDITSAILRLLYPSERSIYFLTGHGEYAPFGTDTQSYSYASLALEVKNYQVDTLNLMTLGSIPEQVTTLVIAGPQKPLLSEEIALIDRFIDQGGNLVVLLEPSIATKISPENDLLSDYLISKWGISLDDDVILDPYVSPPVIAIAEYYGDHPITDKLSTTATLFPTSSSITLLDVYSDSLVTRTKLILTSNASWGETSEEEIISGEPTYTEKMDFVGPLLLAVSGENPTSNTRLVVVGDSDFGSDAYFQEYANGDLILNIIEWTTGESELLNLTPSVTIDRVLVPPSTLSLGGILLATVFLLPGSFIVLGILMLIKQRKTI